MPTRLTNLEILIVLSEAEEYLHMLILLSEAFNLRDKSRNLNSISMDPLKLLSQVLRFGNKFIPRHNKVLCLPTRLLQLHLHALRALRLAFHLRDLLHLRTNLLLPLPLQRHHVPVKHLHLVLRRRQLLPQHTVRRGQALVLCR